MVDDFLTILSVRISALSEKESPATCATCSVPEPSLDRFIGRYGRYVTRSPMDFRNLCTDDLREALRRMDSKQQGGADGWRVAELKRLPSGFLDLLVELFTAVERAGRWPGALLEAVVSLIPKGQGGQPLKMRPITVTSAVYRLWAATRLRDVMAWQEDWINKCQYGFRPGFGTLDAYWEWAAALEVSLLGGEPLSGVSFDFVKCFDRVPHGISLDLAEACGMPG